MNTSDYREKLKQARERKGWPIDEAAWQMEDKSIMSRINYYDIEQTDDSLTGNCSLSQITRACQLLDIRPRDLFCDGPLTPITFDEVAAVIRHHCIKKNLALVDFENKVGWRVESCLDRPKNAFEEWNIDCLKDVCGEIGINWQQVIAGL